MALAGIQHSWLDLLLHGWQRISPIPKSFGSWPGFQVGSVPCRNRGCRGLRGQLPVPPSSIPYFSLNCMSSHLSMQKLQLVRMLRGTGWWLRGQAQGQLGSGSRPSSPIWMSSFTHLCFPICKMGIKSYYLIGLQGFNEIICAQHDD